LLCTDYIVSLPETVKETDYNKDTSLLSFFV